MGEDLTIYRKGVAVPLQNRRTATRVTSAKQTWALNADDTVAITIQSTTPMTFEIGDTISVFGRDYRLNQLPKVKKGGTLAFTYDLTFEGAQYDLLRVQYDVNIDTTRNELQDIQGESLTGDLRRFMTVLIANANRVFPGVWQLGECPETDADKTMTFGESDNCLSVLQNLCGKDNFNVEFDIVKVANNKYRIDLKPNVGQTLPYTFRFGRGLGLYSLDRQNVSSANIVTRLKVFGSTENITSRYRADRLCLPGKTKGQSYIEDAEAVKKFGVFEGRKNFDNIKPSYTGAVTAIVADNVAKFVDANFPFDLNELEDDGKTTKYLVDGLNAKIHFNSGNLAGYEFEIHAYDHKTHTFTLVRQTDERGYTFPSDTSTAFQFKGGDQYKIIDIAYPDNITEKAEAELKEAGETYYKQNSQPKVQYGLTVTKRWLESLMGEQAGVVNIFAPGDWLQIVDEDIAVDKSIRIKSFVRNILDPYDYALTISDTTTTTTITNRVLSELIEIEKLVEINNLNNPARARANWRSSREVLGMVFDPEGNYYSDKIAPLSIDTTMLSVGAKSMQFGLVGTKFEPNTGGNPNTMRWVGGVLTHYTINEEHAVSWNLANGQIGNLNPTLPYYIYAQCARSGSAGQIVVTNAQIKVDQIANSWFFLIGVLNSVDPELHVRTISLTYGFSTINGRFIKTGRIESSGGASSYFDLDDGSMNLGDKLIFNKDGDGRLVLHGTLVQSESGDTFPAGCFRGEYVPGATYYQGDLVTYTADGATSTYMCLDTCTNIPPTNAQYWSLYASQGADGKDGEDGKDGKDGAPGISPNTAFKSTVFKRSTTAPATPTGGSYANPVPSGWSDGVPSGEYKLWASTRVFSSDGKDPQQAAWTTPVQMTDTADFDVEFSAVENPNPPTGHPNTNPEWSNTSDEHTIWMATSRKNNGIWEDWNVSKIKGERGEDGTSIKVKGTLNSESELPTPPADPSDCYIIGQDLWVWDGDSWVNAGQFKGDPGKNGTNGKNAFVHIKFANSLNANDWTANNGETPGAYIGIYTDNLAADRLIWSLYAWTKWKGDDGFGYEYIYKLTSTDAAPDTPTDAAVQRDDYVPEGWTDDPQSVDETNRWCWLCYRKKVDGKWGKFIGSATNEAKAALWSRYALDGENGDPGTPGRPGNFTEFRFAVNGSTTTPPSLVRTNRNPSGWSLTKPTMTTAQYMWMSFAIINGTTNALVQQWSIPVRVTGEKGATGAQGDPGSDGKDGKDGKDGANGKSPAMVFRGDYSASKVYYGNATRLDCVRYNGAYYITRIDAPNGQSGFSGKAPTDTSCWNPFGASFESVATELLLAENANIAGWIFRNGRLESKNGEIFLNGNAGEMRMKGTLQLSTGYMGNYSDVNLFHLPAITATKNITMGYEREDVGKVCRLFNSSPLGGASYNVYLHTFGIKPQLTDVTLGTVIARLDPQEFLEATCFQLPPGDFDLKGSWQMSGRFSTDNWRLDGARKGRFPRMLAMGRFNYGNSPYLTGYMWNGKSISSVMTPKRNSTGNYTISFASGLLTSGYKVMVCGYGSTNIDARVIATNATNFQVGTSDNASMNDGSFDFYIFDPYWYYDLG